MKRPIGPLALVCALILSVIVGCHCCWPPYTPPDPPAGCEPQPVVGGVLPPHPLTAGYAPAGPPAPVPVGAVAVPPAAPPAPTVDVRGYAPLPTGEPQETWHAPLGQAAAPPGLSQSNAPPANAGVTNPPSTPEPPPAPETVRLSPPEAPPTQGEPQVKPVTPPKPAVTEQPQRTAPLPVGIPQFAVVREGVSSGLKPMVDGGLDWLQANRYRTVLHLKAPGSDDSADRQQVEKFGMKYLSLDVSPQTLSPAVVDRFNRIVSDASLAPLFVYDQDGVLAGGLWYLYFRMMEQSSDEAARAKVARLGLKEDGNGSTHEMWLAIQKFLSTPGK